MITVYGLFTVYSFRILIDARGVQNFPDLSFSTQVKKGESVSRNERSRHFLHTIDC